LRGPWLRISLSRGAQGSGLGIQVKDQTMITNNLMRAGALALALSAPVISVAQAQSIFSQTQQSTDQRSQTDVRHGTAQPGTGPYDLEDRYLNYDGTTVPGAPHGGA
jgi:hypothetical protein